MGVSQYRSYGGNPNQLFVAGIRQAFNGIAVDDKLLLKTTGIANKAILGVIGPAGPYDYDFVAVLPKLPFQLIAPASKMPVYHIRQDVPRIYWWQVVKTRLFTHKMLIAHKSGWPQAGGNVAGTSPCHSAGVVIGLAAPLQSFYPTFNKVNDFMSGIC